MIGVTISRCLSHFRDSLIVWMQTHTHTHMLSWVWTSRRTRWRRGTLQPGVSCLSGSVRLRSVSLIRGSLVQDISIGHQQGPRWLCSAASSSTEPVTLLFYRTEGHAPQHCCFFPIIEARYFTGISSQHNNLLTEELFHDTFFLTPKLKHSSLIGTVALKISSTPGERH